MQSRNRICKKYVFFIVLRTNCFSKFLGFLVTVVMMWNCIAAFNNACVVTVINKHRILIFQLFISTVWCVMLIIQYWVMDLC